MTYRPLALVGARLEPDPGRNADAVLLEDGRIARIDTSAAIRRAAPEADTVDLAGRTLAPGFHDAHFHFLPFGIESARASLAAVGSLDEALATVRDANAALAPGEALLAEHWDENAWSVKRWPTRAQLDAISPARPILLRRIDGHTAVANTATIRLFEASGALDGVDLETGACREGPVRRLDEFFPPTPAQLVDGFRTANDRCLALGITTTSDFLLPHSARDYATVLGDHERVRLFVHRIVERVTDIDAFPDLPRAPRFRACGIKIFTDGAIGGRTAALFHGYADRPDETGMLLFDDSELLGMIRTAHERGWTAAVHAIGDRAIAQTVTAFAALPPAENAARRHRIEHFELPRPEDVERMIAAGVRPCVQPNFVGQWAGPGGLYETALGVERARRMNPFRTLCDRGARPFFGSDGMPASPRFGLWSAVHHPVESERLTAREAHRLYTADAAEAVRGDRLSGRIEPGADADLVVLPGPIESWIEGDRNEVDATIVGGHLEYERVPLERATSNW